MFLAIASALSMMGSAYSAYSGYQQGKAQAKIAEQNAQASADMAQQQAELERQRRSQERSSQQDAQKRRRALAEASYATSGVLLEGTPADYLTEQAETDAFNVIQADQDSEHRIKGYLMKGKMDAWTSEAEASAYRSGANASLLSGALQVGATGAWAGHQGAFSWMSSPTAKTATTSTYNSTMLDNAFKPLSLGGR